MSRASFRALAEAAGQDHRFRSRPDALPVGKEPWLGPVYGKTDLMRIEAVYPYRDERGETVFEKVRWRLLAYPPGKSYLVDGDQKTFRYKHRTKHGVRVSGKPKGEAVDALLYRLPEVLEAVAAGRTVWWAEGEKDADALVGAGVCATSGHQGAGKDRINAMQAQWLAGARRVNICMDCDKAGVLDAWSRYKHTVEVLGDAGRVRVVCARGEKNNDVADHLAADLTLAQLIRVEPDWLEATAGTVAAAHVRADGYGSNWSERRIYELIGEEPPA